MKNRMLKQPNIANGAISFLFATRLNLLAQIIMSIVVIALEFSHPQSVDTVNVVGMLVIQICVSFTLLANYKQGIKPGNFSAKWQTVLLAVGLGALSIFGFAVVAGGFDKLMLLLGYENTAYITLNPFSTVVFLIATVICAPVVEELIFRGYLLGGLKTRLPKTVAIILSALAFALVHMSPSQTAYQLCLGLVLGFIACASNSVLPAVIVHSASNLTAFIIAVFNLDLTALSTDSAVGITVFCSLFVLTVTAVIIAVKLMKKWEKTTAVESEKNQEITANEKVTDDDKRVKTIALCAYVTATLICVFMWAMVFIAG